MYPIPPTEKLAETKACRHCGVSFPITDKDLEFYEKVSPVFNGQKYPIPTPTLCPDCRQQRRLSFRNERKLYKRKCDATGRDIISIFSPDKPFKVYHQDFWWSDKWDPMDYGRDFDFSRGFFEQFGELMREIPHMSISIDNSTNSDYSNFILNSKNCYLVYGAGNCEDMIYADFVINCEHSMDCSHTNDCTSCYEIINCDKCFGCSYSINCSDCTDCIGCSDCFGCTCCIRCTNLQNTEYAIDNIPVSKEAYLKELAVIQKTIGLYQGTTQANNIGSENVTGSHIIHSHNCHECRDITDSQDLRFCHFVSNGSDCYDMDFMGSLGGELGYELCTSAGTKYSFGTYICRMCTHIFLSQECRSCEDCFGCIGLRNVQYCIFNKQYTREEYEELVPKIIEHMMTSPLIRGDQGGFEWGEFFPSSLSPFGYNETVAMEYYPLSREEIIPPTPLSKGGSDEGAGGFVHGSFFSWSDYEAPFPRVEKIIPASKLPDDITKIPDDILNWAIECEVTKTRGGNPLFRIVKQELEFYRKHNLPIPRRHPDQRHLDRMKLRNPRKTDVK